VTEPEKQELRQLWFIAQHYWGLAQELAKHFPKDLDKGLRSIACQFNSTAFPSKDSVEYALTLLGAHMASAAIRVSTIDEALHSKSRCVYTTILNDPHDGNDKMYFQDKFDLVLKNCIAVMLRDNVAHIEGKDKKFQRRETYLEGKTYKELYEAMEVKLLAMALQLKKEDIVSCPDIH
jgi:hypothetical protein